MADKFGFHRRYQPRVTRDREWEDSLANNLTANDYDTIILIANVVIGGLRQRDLPDCTTTKRLKVQTENN